MKVIVVGGGIGGLVTAMALDRAGLDIHVYEAAVEVRPLGVGINLLPHAVRHLDRLGAMERLLDLGIETAELAYFNAQGQRIWSEPRGRAAGYDWPQISIHRGELQMALLELAHQRLGAERIHQGHRLVRFSQPDGPAVVAHFSATDAGEITVSGDALIGADGIHSTVRRQLYPDEGPPHWNGGLIFRGLSESTPILSGRTQLMAGGRQTLIAYPMSKAHERRGSALINWAARFFVDSSIGFAPEDWNRRGRLEDFLPRYESWRFDWLDVPALIRANLGVWEFPMVDRDPLPRWSFGRVTLLGDAAHPMVPLGSNGASQAILDAVALADLLPQATPTHDGVTAALARFEADRRPRTAAIVETNRRGGPERVVRIVEKRAPGGFADLETVMPRAELERFAAEYKQLASFDIASVNGRKDRQ